MSADIRFDSLKTIVPAVSRETADRLIAFEDLLPKMVEGHQSGFSLDARRSMEPAYS